MIENPEELSTCHASILRIQVTNRQHDRVARHSTPRPLLEGFGVLCFRQPNMFLRFINHCLCVPNLQQPMCQVFQSTMGCANPNTCRLLLYFRHLYTILDKPSTYLLHFCSGQGLASLSLVNKSSLINPKMFCITPKLIHQFNRMRVAPSPTTSRTAAAP